MTAAQQTYRKQLLAKIHQLPAQQIMKADDTWSDWLNERYGVDSSAKLSIEELKNVLDVLQFGRDVNIQRRNRPKDDMKATAKQLTAIEALWLDKARNKSDAALREFIYVTIRERPLHLEMLTKSQATKIINGIKRL